MQPNQPMGKNQIVKELLRLSAKQDVQAAQPLIPIRWGLLMAPYLKFREVIKHVKRH